MTVCYSCTIKDEDLYIADDTMTLHWSFGQEMLLLKIEHQYVIVLYVVYQLAWFDNDRAASIVLINRYFSLILAG